MKSRSRRPESDEALVAATDAVLVVSRVLVGIAAQSLAATEAHLTLPQYRALVVLSARGDQKVGELAEVLGIHPTTLTRLCDRLVAKHLIERSPSVENRREVTLTLSEAGRALVQAETQQRRAAIRTLVGRLDREAQREIVVAFGAFADAAEQVPSHAWKLGWTA
jgi:DNA-binding MarR family transcriptional regulator